MSDDDSLLDWRAMDHRDRTAPGAVVEIDFEAIDTRNGWTDPAAVAPPDLGALAAALAAVVDALAGPRICKQGREASGLRVYALQWALQRGEIGAMTMTEAAAACSVTPAAFSLAVRSVGEVFGLRFRGQRMASKRENFKAGARRRWGKRKVNSSQVG